MLMCVELDDKWNIVNMFEVDNTESSVINALVNKSSHEVMNTFIVNLNDDEVAEWKSNYMDGNYDDIYDDLAGFEMGGNLVAKIGRNELTC